MGQGISEVPTFAVNPVPIIAVILILMLFAALLVDVDTELTRAVRSASRSAHGDRGRHEDSWD